MSKQAGIDMKMYYNSNTYASPTWALVDNVQDLDGPDSYDLADLSRRFGGIAQAEPTLRKIEFSWKMVYDLTDTAFAAIRTRYFNRTLIELAFADDLIATTGTVYFAIECKIQEFIRSEPLSGGTIYSVKAGPCYSKNAPRLVTV